MMRSVHAICLLAAFFFVAISGPGHAAQGGSETPIIRSNVISTNAILDMFTWYNLEYERRILPNGTIGIAGSYVTLNDENDTYTSLNAFFRWYPQGKAPDGFFFGGRLGTNAITDKHQEDILGNVEPAEKFTVFGFGIDIGYTWLIGNSQRFALSLGIGAMRFFGGDLEDVTTTLPTIRLINTGIAF
jgi:hypothetical protein